MSMFYCALCDNLSDSDEGCIEAKDEKFGLICVDCENEMEDEESEDEDNG